MILYLYRDGILTPAEDGDILAHPAVTIAKLLAYNCGYTAATEECMATMATVHTHMQAALSKLDEPRGKK